MELAANKRKKRKTRKYLDEIRKRSLRNTFADLISEVSSKQTKSKVNHTENREKNFIITSKRLTLIPPGFSKAVSSETITRPTISAEQVNIKKYVANVLQTTDSRTITARLKSQLDPKNNGTQIEISGEPYVSEESLFQNETASERENVSPDSLVKFSPADIPSTPASSRNLAPGSGGNRLYAQFLKEVPFHIERNSPLLINKHVMKKTKTFLQNVYMEGCRRESEKTILHCMNSKNVFSTGNDHNRSETPSSIIQNPMDYIKMGILRRNSEQEDSPITSQPCSPSSPQEASPLAVIRDTPDYAFYPRKLNQ